MRNARPLVVIAISVVIGFISVALAAQWIGRHPSIAITKVVVAARDLPIGTPLAKDMVQLVDWPAGAPITDPIRSVDDIKDRVITASVLRGEPIVSAKLAPKGETGGISAGLPGGARAITVKVNEIAGVAGFALPGNYVDVMVNTTDENNKSVSKIVLERILVLAVAQQAETRDNKPRVVDAVTLQVSPQEAESIDLARSVGSLSLVLRSQLEPRGTTVTAGARKNDLLKLASAATTRIDGGSAAQLAPPAATPQAKRPSAAPAAAKPQAPVAEPGKLEIIRGTKKTIE